ncbi:MAG: Rne/Rng family ribonuclease [Candidatus Hinthialibacter antarcticus]|nr:Rne/Rng family ribonuclease [Candidatus Hinthialibacter antarcticus]
MQRQIIVSADDYEVRIAVLENSKLAEYAVERRDEKRIVGNIYKGVVTSIIPGIEAAFIDIGLARNAFLYVNDLYPQMDEFGYFSEDESGYDDDENSDEPKPELPPLNISDLLQEHQEILVQLYKEPIGAKGSRVTTNISLPGRYTVLLPCTSHIGVSRRIEDLDKREELKETVAGLLPDSMGGIVRTAGHDASEEDFKKDIDSLCEEWERIDRKSQSSGAPSLVHQAPGMVYLLILDLISEGIDELIVDDPALYTEVVEYVKMRAPTTVHRITFYDDSTPVFRTYGLESDINNLRSRKVWLKCGGYIVIDETEAMTVVDVNTGRYLGKHNLEETVYKTNLDAASEIVRQLRLRDIGGIIIIDFIDMKEKEHQDHLMSHLEEHLVRDRTRTHLYPLTDLGLLQMTRKRVRKSLNKSLTQPCPYCKREGSILSTDTMIVKIFRTFEEICNEEDAKSVTLRVHPRIAKKILEGKAEQLASLEERYGAALKILPGEDLHFEQIVEEIS